MEEFKYLQKSRIKTTEMIKDTQTFISRVYNRAGTLFTSASPFAQILNVLQELSSFVFTYIEDALMEQNILTAQHKESIYGLSRLAGHDPFRGSSAQGEIRIRLNPSAASDVAGEAINILPDSLIKMEANGLKYTMLTNSDKFRVAKTSTAFIRIPIIQGVVEKQTVTGTGEKFQSFNIITKGNTDHGQVRVSVNSIAWQKYDSIYDMKVGTSGFVVKTGISGGLDIYFGNGSFGALPVLGSSIEVSYIKNQGDNGNLIGGKNLRFKFDADGFDSIGNSYDLNELLETEVTVTPRMGSNPESVELTKLIAPMQSHSFVLATPDNYEAFLSRYGMFSYLDAYSTTDDGYLDDDNVIYLFMLPDVKRKLIKSKDYFSLEIDEFFFSEDENNAILNTIEKSGRQMLTSEVKIAPPSPQYFRMDIKIRYFEGFDKHSIFNNIRASISEYLMNITRRDRLPKSDIIAILEGVAGIDSVNVRFVSKAEEDARRKGYFISETVVVTPSTPILEDIGNGQQKMVFFKRTIKTRKVKFEPNAALPENLINLDSFGDILLEKDEVALFRGGWKDRDGIMVEDDALIGEMGALSVYFDEPAVPQTLFTRVQAKNRKNL
jgi:hypothetical protein